MYRVEARSELLWYRASAAHVFTILGILLHCGRGIVGRGWQKNVGQKDEEGAEVACEDAQ